MMCIPPARSPAARCAAPPPPDAPKVPHFTPEGRSMHRMGVDALAVDDEEEEEDAARLVVVVAPAAGARPAARSNIWTVPAATG